MQCKLYFAEVKSKQCREVHSLINNFQWFSHKLNGSKMRHHSSQQTKNTSCWNFAKLISCDCNASTETKGNIFLETKVDFFHLQLRTYIVILACDLLNQILDLVLWGQTYKKKDSGSRGTFWKVRKLYSNIHVLCREFWYFSPYRDTVNFLAYKAS